MRKAILVCAVLALCGAAQVEQPKQEQKAQPASGSGAVTIAPPPWCKDAKFGELCVNSKGWIQINFPFDIPAKEGYGCPYKTRGCIWSGTDSRGPHYWSCEGVADDWKQRVLLDSADGKHHCYAFYLLSQR